jgi:translation initiation factor IF-2
MTGEKMRVYEIAKEVGIPNKDLIAKIRALGLEVNNHMSSLDADDVARIKRSLEKEKHAVAAPAQTQRLSTGAVLRRRSSGDKSADGEKSVEVAPVRAAPEPARSPAVARPVAATPAPAPVVRRRVVAEEPEVQEAPAPVVRRAARPEPAPVPVEHKAPRIVEAKAPPIVVETPKHPEPVPAPQAEARRPTPEAPAAAAEPPPKRVIVAGPRVVARSNDGASAPQPRAAEPPPPASTPLPPRVTPVRIAQAAAPAATGAAEPRAIDQPPDSARSRFELELERARARTAEKKPDAPDGVQQHADGAAVSPAPAPAREGRPAVGTVIALPPRIKITERTPMTGRPAPGPQPVNPIRGRFAQQQQRGGPRPGGRPGGPGGAGGSYDMRKKLPLGKKGKQTQVTTPAEHKRVIRIEDTIAIQDLARNMGIKAPQVLAKLWGMGMTGVNINASIDFDTAQILASEFGYEVQNVAFKEEDVFAPKGDEADKLLVRAPVVTVMGHVDHGKTSLLDAIRKTRVAAGEAGGITQHIAAYKIKTPDDREIVFLDTPGHEAFTEMRARGAQATDIVVLVVAANDGVMPQTVEALSHAKDAKVSIIVAVNKIDLPDAQPERVKQQLADHGLIPEEWGGDTMYVNVSALKGENIDKLLESIAVTAEVLELKANADKPASGLVIEARLDRNRGPMATVLIQEGTLHVGDILVAGRTFGKVRAMLDDRGESLEEAGPSTPIEVLGLDGVPEAGDQVNAAEDDKVAKQVVDHRREQYRKRELGGRTKVSLENMMERLSESSETKELKIVLKADVQGSAEALKAALTKLATEKVKVTVIAAAVGGITESDVHLAKAGGAIIVGFHVRPAGKSSKLAEQEGVEIRLYDIIYDALDEVKAAMAGLLAPIKREVAMGKLQVRETFSIPKIGTVAGCMVTEGKINRKAHLRIIRDAVQVYEGKIGSLRRFKDDVSEVQHGFECGVMVAGWNEVKQGDVIEAYEVIEEAAQL